MLLISILVLGLQVDEARIHALIENLSSDSLSVREEAVEELVKLGDRAVPALEKASQGDDPEARVRAMDALREIYRPLDSLPAPERARLGEVEARVAELRQAGRGKESAALAAQLRAVRNRILRRDVARGAKGVPELHVVGLYEGVKDGSSDAVVRIDYTDRPVVLALSAYESVTWSLKVAPKVRIRRILVGGYEGQRILNAPTRTPIDRFVRADGEEGEYFFAFLKDKRYRHMARVLRKHTGLEITTFTGSYRMPRDPILIGQKSTDWLSQMSAHLIARTHAEATREARERMEKELLALRFRALRFVEGRLPRFSSQLGTFSLRGPDAGSLQPLSEVVKAVAGGAERKALFGITAHKLFRVDAGTGKAEEVEGPSDLGWPSAIAYDTKRERVLIVDLAGANSYLRAADPRTGRWVTLVGNRFHRAQAMAYAPEEDALYAAGNDRDPDNLLAIQKFNMKGALLRKIPLGETLPGSRSLGYPGLQMVWLGGGRLVLLHYGQAERRDPAEGIATATVVEAATGKILYRSTLKLR